MSDDKRGMYILIAIALLVVIAISMAFYYTYRPLADRDINDGDKGMIIGFQ